MRIIIAESYRELSREAARIVARWILLKGDSVLGLPTGQTPLGMYEELVRMCQLGIIDFSRVVTFNLDEYYGLPPDHPNSYHRYMQERLFAHVNIPADNINIPNGITGDVAAECRRYETLIRKHGGIDLQILGIGPNGHIGFNEPGTDWEMTVGLVTLSKETRAREARHFHNILDVPTQAITMGIKMIMQAREILLLAAGSEKAQAVKRALEGPITKEVPASVLQLHPNVTVLLDHEASALLKHENPIARVVVNI